MDNNLHKNATFCILCILSSLIMKYIFHRYEFNTLNEPEIHYDFMNSLLSKIMIEYRIHEMTLINTFS